MTRAWSTCVKHLVEYVTQVYTAGGQSPQQAATSAQAVLQVETELANSLHDRTPAATPRTATKQKCPKTQPWRWLLTSIWIGIWST